LRLARMGSMASAMPIQRFAMPLSIILLSTIASAQAVPPAGQANPAAPVAPGRVGPADPTSPPALVEPKLPEVNDPMLAAPVAPDRLLASWQETLTFLRTNSSNLRETRARIQQAEARARVALAPALPQLDGDAGVNHHLLTGERTGFGTVPDPRTTWNAGLNLRIPLLARSAWYDRGTALEAADAAKLDATEIERQEIATVANAIVTVVTAERLAEVSRVSLRSALSTLDLNKRRAALGAASTVDVLRTEQEVSASRAQVVDADENLNRAREALGIALGSSQAWGVAPGIRLDTLASDARQVCRPENRIEARPDVRASEASVRVAERSVKSIDYTYWPTVDAVSNLTYWSHEVTSANNEHVTWTIGGVLSFPLYDGGARYGTRAVNRAELALSRERLTETKRRASVEVAQAVRSVRVAEANLRVSAQSREIARETARLTRIAYLNGSGTSFDLVDSARRLRETEIDFAIQEFEVVRARIAALLALATCNV
jgi:multidrug efflux system outer membrane protein